MTDKKKNKYPEENKPVKAAAVKTRSNMPVVWLCAAAIALYTFIVFSPSLNDGFTNWDDNAYVTNNPQVVNNSIPVVKIFETPVAGNYHPLTILSLALNYQVGKLDPFSYHAVNLICHVLNTILVFFFIFLLTRRNVLMAAIVSLFFGIHPMHVESVTWISERKDVLYVFFILAGFITYLRYSETKKAGWYGFTLLLFILSCLCKAMAVIMPVILLLVDYLRGRKFENKVLIEKIPFFIISIAVGVVAFKVQQSSQAISALKLFTIPQRLLLASYGAVMYIIKFFAPVRLSVLYPYPDVYGAEGIPATYYGLSVTLLLLIAAIIYFFIKNKKEIVFGLLFYFVSIILVLQLINVGFAIIADRYSYLSYIGLLFVVAYLVNRAWHSKAGMWNLLKYPLIGIIVFAIIIFGYQTYARTRVWNDGETLWTDAINKYNNAAVAYVNRGNYYITQNDMAKALADYNTALKFNVFSATAYRDAYYNRGLIFYNYGKYDSAFADMTKVIEIQPNNADAYLNRGNIYYDGNKNNLALADYKKALAFETDSAEPYNNCGLIYYRIFKDDSAIMFYNKAIAISPANALYYYNRGLEYKAMNMYGKALDDFNTGIKLNPKNIVLYYYMRGMSYAAINKYDEAVADFSRAIELNPTVAEYWLSRSFAEDKLGEKENAKTDAAKGEQLK